MAMGAPSRNAVCGKAYRLKLSARVTKHDNTGKRSNGRRRRNGMRRLFYFDGYYYAGEGTMIDEAPPGFTNPKPFIELADCHCRWPGEGAPGPQMLCCAEPALDGYPYCATHYRIAYVRPGARLRPPQS
jgi:hypothetical protein